MTKVKICGIQTFKDVEYVNRFLPDYVGFVFARSKRQISDSQAKLLKQAIKSSIQVVGVFVNEPIDHVAMLCKTGIIDVIQLHGEESVDYARDLHGRVDKPIIKAVRVQNRQQIVKMADYPCEYFLFDTYVEGSMGGTGKSFDVECIPHIDKPYFVAGGLDSDNVCVVVNKCNPYCVDVSSGVETEHKKDEEKIAAFIKAVRKDKKITQIFK